MKLILKQGAGQSQRFLFGKKCKRQALLHIFAEANCTFTIRTKLMLEPLFFSKIRLKTRLLPKPSQPSKNTQRSCSNSRPLYYVCQSKFMSRSIHLMVLRLAVLEVDVMSFFFLIQFGISSPIHMIFKLYKLPDTYIM